MVNQCYLCQKGFYQTILMASMCHSLKLWCSLYMVGQPRVGTTIVRQFHEVKKYKNLSSSYVCEMK